VRRYKMHISSLCTYAGRVRRYNMYMQVGWRRYNLLLWKAGTTTDPNDASNQKKEPKITCVEYWEESL
jgi:hypothetical protein